MKALFQELKYDLPASIVVVFVALPLCLGIALASGVPLFAGIIAGIVGGIIIGIASGSRLGVSGPAAGLIVIVLTSIEKLGGSWETFLLAVIVAGVIQIIAGYLKLGTIAYYFPSSVIKGMLAGIGLLIILKQIPHALGYDVDFLGSEAFSQLKGGNTFSNLINMISFINPAVVLITVVSMFILILWEAVLVKKHRIFQMVNGPLVVVFVGILFNYFYQINLIPFSLNEAQIVQIPVASTFSDFFRQFTIPDFSQITNPKVYMVACVIAIIASLETLLSLEATDKLDPEKRITPPNRELKAQGLGNLISGLVGGLPLTQVIVRSSANVTFGARTKLSTILHGFFLLICVIFIPTILNQIPLSTLASILFVVGYKLAKPALFIQVYRQGAEQFVPFLSTVIGILFTDLLKGIGIGMAVAILYLLRNNFRNPFYVFKNGKSKEKKEYVVTLAEDVSFINKASIREMFNKIPPRSQVIVDGTKSKSIHYDVLEIIQDFLTHAKTIGVSVKLIGLESFLESVKKS